MKALIVLDMQEGLLSQGRFDEEITKVKNLISDFEQNQWPVFIVKHVDEVEDSPLLKGSKGSELISGLGNHKVIEKSTPNAFTGTNLFESLKEKDVNHLFVAGLNTEYCCLFTAIAAQDRGFKVTFLEDATATVNNADTYEMPGLDIKDFVGSVLNWSGAIEVLYVEEYQDDYLA